MSLGHIQSKMLGSELLMWHPQGGDMVALCCRNPNKPKDVAPQPPGAPRRLTVVLKRRRAQPDAAAGAPPSGGKAATEDGPEDVRREETARVYETATCIFR